MLVATAAATYVYNGTPDPKNWMVTFLISKWGIDQITAYKAVSVSLGKDTIQFIQQPDGTFTPPANCTMTLTRTNGAFVLRRTAWPEISIQRRRLVHQHRGSTLQSGIESDLRYQQLGIQGDGLEGTARWTFAYMPVRPRCGCKR